MSTSFDLQRGAIVAAASLAFLVSDHARPEVRALSPEVRQFESPMVLELTLEKFLAIKPGERWTTYELRSFIYRGVTIGTLSALQKPSQGKGPPTLDLILYLQNNSGKDKRVTVKIELRQAEDVRSTAELNQVSVEQGDPRQKHTSLPLSVLAGSDQPPPVLRLTLSLFDY